MPLRMHEKKELTIPISWAHIRGYTPSRGEGGTPTHQVRGGSRKFGKEPFRGTKSLFLSVAWNFFLSSKTKKLTDTFVTFNSDKYDCS